MAKRAAAVARPLVDLDHRSAIPLSRQLYERLREAILSGQLAPGARLPSTRGLADQLGVARNTVLGVYEQLGAEGYLESAVGRGTMVARVAPDRLLMTPAPVCRTRSRKEIAPEMGLTERNRALQQLSSGIRPWLAAGEGAVPAFRVGVPALDVFPQRLWARLVARRARQFRPDALTYQSPAGYPPLREAIAAYLGVARGVRCSAEQVLITAGAQGALDLAARVLLEPGDAAWMENPGYFGARGALLAAGARLVPVPVDREGLNVAEGIARAPQARLAMVTPSRQSPLGVTMSVGRRLALLEWAKQAHAWIVEDDYDSEYRFVGRPLEALQALDENERVLYVGTFSKVLFPALRLGYLIVPPGLVDVFIAARRFIDTHAPLLEQAVVTDFMIEGHFLQHIRRMRTLYAGRRAALVAAAKRELGEQLEFQAPAAGLHLVGWLRPGLDDAAVSRRAALCGVETIPLSRFALEPLQRGGLLLGYAPIPEREIVGGVQRLALALAEERRL
jgi:GntR family transcriptional regulator/MocR family aminotransferase